MSCDASRFDHDPSGRARWSVDEWQSIIKDLYGWAQELPAVRTERPMWYLERYGNSSPVGVFLPNPSPDEASRVARVNRLAEFATRCWKLYDPSLGRSLKAMAEAHGLTVRVAKRGAIVTGLYEAWIESDGQHPLILKKGREWRRPVELPLRTLWSWLVKRAIHHAEASLQGYVSHNPHALPLDSGRVPDNRRAFNTPSDLSPDPLEALIAAESAADRDARFEALLDRAPPREKELLQLLKERALTNDEAATLMGIEASTVGVFKHRLRRRAREL